MTDPVFIGVDWFPEHWPVERWARDLELMREAGMRVVRIAEFTWSKTQPGPGRWEWDWLERAVDAIAAAGLQVILCTPSACPPPWMVAEDPTILPEIAPGRTLGLGHRRHYSPHHAGYRQASADVAARMAERWGAHQAVVGYQIDNELCGALDDVGPLARRAFQAWLRQRHGDLRTLDERLGLVFWSQQYDAWEQIPLPVDTTFHPGLRLEFQRFSSQAWVAFCRAQADAMRPHLGSAQVLTTNCYLPYWGMVVDWAELQRDGGLDLIAIDNYARTAADGAFFNDLARSISDPYWILEQQCGSTAAQHIWPDRQGRIAEDTGIAVAKGAQAITYFRWRQARWGNEQDHGAVLDHHGEPGPIYQEVQAVCRAHAERGRPEPRVAVAFTWDDARMAALPGGHIAYEAEMRGRFGAALHARGLDARYATDPEQLAGVELVLLPFKLGHEPAWEEAVLAALQAGATVVAFPLCFARDQWNAYREDYLSPAMEEAFGIDVRRRIPLREGVAVPGGWEGAHVGLGLVCEELDVRDAQVLARFTGGPADGPLPDGALLTQKRHASGSRALWCAGYPDAAGVELLLGRLL